MEVLFWILSVVFFCVAFVLLILLIVRTGHRAWHYHDCCRPCRKSTPRGEPKPKQTPSGGIARGRREEPKPKQTGEIAQELQAINDRQRKEQEAADESLGRTNSQTFDPLNPDSLELPIHGIHFPDPGEEIEEEDTPPGGHNDDFRIVNVGVDEPDKPPAGSESKQGATNGQELVGNAEDKADTSQDTAPESKSSQQDTPSKEGGESPDIHINGGVTLESQGVTVAIPIQETGMDDEMVFSGDITRAESNQHDTPTKEDEGSGANLINGRVPQQVSDTEKEATPIQEENPEPTEDIARAQDKDELVTRETEYEVMGSDNPVEVDDSELYQYYV